MQSCQQQQQQQRQHTHQEQPLTKSPCPVPGRDDVGGGEWGNPKLNYIEETVLRRVEIYTTKLAKMVIHWRSTPTLTDRIKLARAHCTMQGCLAFPVLRLDVCTIFD